MHPSELVVGFLWNPDQKRIAYIHVTKKESTSSYPYKYNNVYYIYIIVYLRENIGNRKIEYYNTISIYTHKNDQKDSCSKCVTAISRIIEQI